MARLARRDDPRTEADVQADVRQLLLTAPLDLTDKVLLETQVGGRRRIDVEVGSTVIEVKKDLRKGNVRTEAVGQLAGYVAARAKKLGARYVGVLTDGAEWLAFHLDGTDLREVTAHSVVPARPDVEGLLRWLEGVLATTHDIAPSPEEIRSRLGAGSSAHLLDRASLASLFKAHANSPAVLTRRRLWARLLETALGTQFEDRDDLFLNHTLLVNTADIIAHAVLGLAPESLPPRSILSGEAFDAADIHGVVEADFFDWVTEVPGGDAFIRTLARRLMRFDWSAIQHDVLKVLYESIITADVRKHLGEYYTPDWLAQKVVEETVPKPLETRVLDAACGSGTFLFHAVRRYVEAAIAEKTPVSRVVEGVTQSVVGMDLHPVAVGLARITYLLAFGTELLRHPERGRIRVPVFLGDSLQWRDSDDLFTPKELAVPISDSGQLFTTEKSSFRFPNSLLEDAQRFDALVTELSDLATDRPPGSIPPSIAGLLKRHTMSKQAQGIVETTYQTLCGLHDDGRDHIWSYFIRNLVRPSWLTRSENKVDALVGNPPWLAYRFMPGPMQEVFKKLSETRGLWQGAKVATQQDLSVLFVVRIVERYLREGGRFGFVLPSAVLDRQQYAGFRKGTFGTFPAAVRLAFDPPWDLRRLRPHFFPIAASVAFGRVAHRANAMPQAGEVWLGRLPERNASWAEIESIVERKQPPKRAAGAEASEYSERFRNGATIVPRVLFLVNQLDPGPLGLSAGNARIASARSANEKKPWKDLPPLEGVIEREFLFRVHLGETVLPYRTLTPRTAVLPITRKGKFYPGDPRILEYPRLAKWWAKAEAIWLENRSSDRLSLLEQLDYHGKLKFQFPLLQNRIVYSKSGMHLAAARIDDLRAVIDHKLYWGSVASVAEAHFLCAILNSAVVTARVRPLMSYGKDERDIDKYVWQLPIPMFNREVKAHARLSELGRQAEAAIADLDLPDNVHFSAVRRRVREWLEQSDIGQEIEATVAKLLG